MKALSSGPALSGLSPGKESLDNKWPIKEKSIGDILTRAPDAVSPSTKEYGTNDWAKGMFDEKNEISEASLSEGFTFPPRAPHRPGQFTNIPRPGLFKEPLDPRPPEPCQTPAGPSVKKNSGEPVARASPLDLPELCLPGKSSKVDTTQRQKGDAVDSKKQQLKSKFFLPSSDTVSADLSCPQSCSPNDAGETAQVTKLLSPPKLTSSPTQLQHSGLLTAINHRSAVRKPAEIGDLSQHRPHAKNMSSNPRRQSTPSVCGDLELPTYYSPATVRHRHKHHTTRPMIHGSTKRHEHPSRHRSSSIASSNISKKRSRAHNLHVSPNSDRKLLAMEQAAIHWNECVQISAEESSAARREAQRLQEEIHQQESELEKARELLNQKDAKLSEIEKLYTTLLEEDARVVGDNKTLNEELTTLRQQLSEEMKQREFVDDRHRACRDKLNEAIKEQQELFVRSRAFYEEMMDELRKENARKTLDSDAVEKALESSRQKRDEMKNCLEEYRMQMEEAIKQKNQAVSELKERLALQEVLLAQEKLFANHVNTQTEEQTMTYQRVRTLEAKVDALIAHQTEQDEQRHSDAQQNTQLMKMLSLKLDSLVAGGNLVVSNMLSRDDLDLKLAAAENNIIQRLSPAINSLEHGQLDMTNVVTQLEASIGRSLDVFKDEAVQLMDTCKESKEGGHQQVEEVLAYLQKLDHSLKKTESLCEEMGQKFDVLAGSEQSNQRETSNLLQDVLQQLSARENRLDNLERQILQAYEGFAEKIESTVAGAISDGGETTAFVKSAAAELCAALEKGFGQEKERTLQLLQGNEDLVKVLTSHLDEQKKLASQTDHNTCELQATLTSEREAAAQLRRQIQGLEQKNQETEELRKQWLKDIGVVDTIRTQLKAIKERIPQIENCDKKLDRIVEISRSIQSSASYLTTEREWVQAELEGKMPKPVASEPGTSGEATKMPMARSIEAPEVTERCVVKEDVISRKVTVHSPDPGEGSPLPPPTVMQEQKRRREITQLRSILKTHALPGAHETGDLEGPSARPQANHGKPSQSLNGSLNKSTSASAKDMVAEIRSRLLRHDWSFPTVADFERDVQLASKKRQAPHDDQVASDAFDANNRDSKKARTNCCTE
ncbi:uncharacterized protein TRIREDRAFT_109189 [Trichoderma reesei QM6a]|uniref:Predicted protein n=1 Tax=Hypocrea jecorina (strain QM6a) TaxID=431241 RepID=G0RNI7_HYPJQ|nr:uncharacterized protein TRIREDRAFT_109189 [Trichoderma reesei QM6a]EGR47361.1 predicted protein [Trichoderma reesei QM6a]